ncbi:MAG: LamG-like jellyroll fold domain-containing protein [Rhodospirillaceae bacterium]|nr:LamG-like jellyroll fold domain-containing protein [Rhodospirillaceae bacterium]
MFIAKPPIWNRLNSEHALARGLACAFYFRGPGDYYDLVTGSRVLPESADKRFVIGRPGRVAEFNGASASAYDTQSVTAEFLPIKTSNGSYTGDFTLAVFSNPAADGQIRFQAGQRRNGGSFSQVVLEANADSTLVSVSNGRMAFGVYSGAYGGVVTHAGGVDGDWHLWVGTRIGTLHELYQDGVSVGTATATALAIGEANSNFGIGIRPDFANDYIANNQIGFVVAWNRGLSPGEVREFTRNPWALIGWPDTQVGSVATIVAAFKAFMKTTSVLVSSIPFLSKSGS